MKLNVPIKLLLFIKEYATKIINVITAAGNEIFMFVLNLSFMATPCVFVAAIVVSDINDKLSPNIDPPTTAPTHNGSDNDPLDAIPTAIGTNTVIEPTLVPIAIDIKHAIKNNPGTSKL